MPMLRKMLVGKASALLIGNVFSCASNSLRRGEIPVAPITRQITQTRILESNLPGLRGKKADAKCYGNQKKFAFMYDTDVTPKKVYVAFGGSINGPHKASQRKSALTGKTEINGGFYSPDLAWLEEEKGIWLITPKAKHGPYQRLHNQAVSDTSWCFSVEKADGGHLFVTNDEVYGPYKARPHCSYGKWFLADLAQRTANIETEKSAFLIYRPSPQGVIIAGPFWDYYSTGSALSPIAYLGGKLHLPDGNSVTIDAPARAYVAANRPDLWAVTLHNQALLFSTGAQVVFNENLVKFDYSPYATHWAAHLCDARGKNCHTYFSNHTHEERDAKQIQDFHFVSEDIYAVSTTQEKAVKRVDTAKCRDRYREQRGMVDQSGMLNLVGVVFVFLLELFIPSENCPEDAVFTRLEIQKT